MSDRPAPDTVRDELLAPPWHEPAPAGDAASRGGGGLAAAVGASAGPSGAAGPSGTTGPSGPLPLYAAHFGLKREPFSIAPDPRYLFMSERHREALAHLLFGVRSGGGFVLLTGEIGAGKTTVCRCFLEQIPPDVNVAYVLNPRQSVDELLVSVCEEFRIPVPPGPRQGVKPLVDSLNHYLLGQHAAGRSNVLIIDEAQNLDSDVLEQLRLLTNLETAERKLLQIMLIGQPELRDMLEEPRLEQLAQRVIARYHLRALSLEDTARYIQHRLAVAGAAPRALFDEPALALVHEVSRGVPRRINLLCDRALLGCYARGRPGVDPAMVEKAALEVFGKPAPSVQRRRTRLERQQTVTLVLAGVLLGLAAAAFATWWVSRADPPADPRGAAVTPR
jgi:general secretion pathway protein A